MTFLGSMASAAVSYDLSGDWSDLQNSHGPWSYEVAPGVPLTNHLADWNPSHTTFTSSQPAWAAAPYPQNGHIATFFKTVSALTAGGDVPIGKIFIHNNDPFNSLSSYGNQAAGISWKAPANGPITITGDLWEAAPSLNRK